MKTSGLQVETCRLADGEAPVVTRYASFSPTRSELGELGTKVGKHLRAQFGDLVFGVETVACECNAGSTFGLRLVMRADAPVEHVVRATFEVAGSDPTLRLPLALVPAPPPPACAEPDP